MTEYIIWLLYTVYDKTFKEENFAVCQQHSLCKKNFHSLPVTANFSFLIMNRKIFSGKTFAVNENPRKP